MKLKSISPSRIKTFDMCKFKYWLTYHTKLALKSNWGAAHGSLIHDVLEYYVNGEDSEWVDRLYRGYGGTLETIGRYGDPETMESPLVWAKSKDFADKKPFCDTCPYVGEDKCTISQEPLDALTGCPRDLFDNSISMVENTMRRYEEIWPRTLKDSDGKMVGCEYQFNIKVPGTDVPMIGIIDLVTELDEDTIEVIDYKTGSWTQNYDECREDIQVRMYSLAARREFIDDVAGKGYKYKNILLTFDYFTEKPITVAFSEEEDLETEEYVRKKIEEIQSTEWIDRIVRSNEDLDKRSAWKCRSLCDAEVCKANWKGRFNING